MLACRVFSKSEDYPETGPEQRAFLKVLLGTSGTGGEMNKGQADFLK